MCAIMDLQVFYVYTDSALHSHDTPLSETQGGCSRKTRRQAGEAIWIQMSVERVGLYEENRKACI